MRAIPAIKWFVAGLAITGVVGAALYGPRGSKKIDPPIEIFPDMDRQPKFKTQQPSRFFRDGRADRPPVPGTVPFGVPIDNPYLATGKMGNHWGDGIPVKVDRALIERGQKRYAINCLPCHGALADGKGIVQTYGFNLIANLHQPRILEMADGEIFNTIAHGKGQMGAYPHTTIEDRWAIIAYLRVLQKARNATIADAPAAERAKLEAIKAEPAPAPGATNAPPAATNAPPPSSSSSNPPPAAAPAPVPAKT